MSEIWLINICILNWHFCTPDLDTKPYFASINRLHNCKLFRSLHFIPIFSHTWKLWENLFQLAFNYKVQIKFFSKCFVVIWVLKVNFSEGISNFSKLYRSFAPTMLCPSHLPSLQLTWICYKIFIFNRKNFRNIVWFLC